MGKSKRPELRWGLLALAMLLTGLVYLPSLHNGWTNWDDDLYVLENPLVRDFADSGTGAIFREREVAGNYHPLTVLSLALDHQLGGVEPFGYHLHNLLLHLLNVALVFALLLRWTRHRWGAFLGALLFGLHPLHVESVAWISERKDLLYTFYLLAGLLSYQNFRDAPSGKGWWYGLSLLLMLAAVLSKAMAVVFPVLLLLEDFLRKRNWTITSLLEKAPFFAVAVGFGLLAMATQADAEALGPASSGNWLENAAVAAYGLCWYTFRFLVPVELSAFHPYPWEAGESMPGLWWLWLVPVVAAAALAWRFRNSHRKWVFAGTFFGVCLLPVLQLVPVGQAIVAERYTYLAYLGLVAALAWGLAELEQLPGYRNGVRAGLAVGIAAMAWLTWNRLPVWQNSETLWSDVIDQYPDHYFGYGSRGMALRDEDPGRAMLDLDRALEMQPSFWEGRLNRGVLALRSGQLERALGDLNQVLEQVPQHGMALLNRGTVHLQLGNPKAAISDLSRALENGGPPILVHQNRGVAYKQMGRYAEAVSDYTAALELDPNNSRIWFNKGYAECLRGQLAQGADDLGRATQLEPEYGEAHYFLAVALKDLGRLEEAKTAAIRAEQLGIAEARALNQELAHPIAP